MIAASNLIDQLLAGGEPEPADLSEVFGHAFDGSVSSEALGGLLVAVAALGLYATVRSAGAPPQTSYVVARAAIAPGTTLTADLLGAQRVDLPDSLAAATFSIDQDELVLGAVAVEPIAAGDLVHRSDVADADRAELAPFEMSFRIDADRAVAGSLRAGDV